MFLLLRQFRVSSSGKNQFDKVNGLNLRVTFDHVIKFFG